MIITARFKLLCDRAREARDEQPDQNGLQPAKTTHFRSHNVKNWKMNQNFQELLSKKGSEFIEELSTTLEKRNSIDTLAQEQGVNKFRGGSGGREVLPLPDSMVHGEYLPESETETSFVIKVSGKPLPHNYFEIEVWKKACELGGEHKSLFAPIHAWDEKEYKWVIMRRVTPISPIKADLSYLLSGQEYEYDPDAPEQFEQRLDDLGWTADDVEMNIGILDGDICMMDYGGVERRDNPVELPNWIM